MPIAEVTGNLHNTGDLLADNEVEQRVHFSAARAVIARACRDLQHAADGKSHWLFARFRQQVDLGADERVAELVADPSATHERVIHVDAAVPLAAEPEDGARIAVDSSEESHSAEDLCPI